VKTRDRSSFFEAAAYAVGGTFGVAMAMGGLLVVVSVAIFIITEFGDKIINWISTYELNDVIIYMVSWILLLAISISAAWEIQHTLGSASQNYRRRRALAISLIISLVPTVILFKQPYLDAVFGGEDMNQVLGAIVFATGAASGWVVWYLKEIKRYGDFFYVLLLTITIGLCWYARLTAPEPVQITAVAFVLGSLFRIARDYMDAAVSVGEERASAGSEDGGLAKAPSPTQVRTQSANSPRRRGDRSKGAHP
jgi:hypothetical protein